VHAMNKQFIFLWDIQLGNIQLIKHLFVSEDKLDELAKIFDSHQRIKQVGIL
jgi:hypothetical protein